MVNERYGKTRVSVIREVWVRVYELDIHIVRLGLVAVNGVRVYLPWCYPPSTGCRDGAPGQQVLVRNSGSNGIEVKTDFDLRVVYWNDYRACVYTPKVPGLMGHLCGFAGDCDNWQNNDFRLPDGTLTSDANTFGDSWILPDTDRDTCVTGKEMGNTTCDPSVLLQAKHRCEILRNATGPFSMCQNLTDLDVESFWNDCTFDQCATDLNEDQLCDTLGNFATRCQALLAGQKIPWRGPDLCPITCGPHQTYDACGTGCPATCQDPFAPDDCSQPCFEGCFCNEDDGYVLSGRDCVLLEDCGCTDNSTGQYHPSHSHWVNDDCTQDCTCSAGLQSCVDMSCAEHASCKVRITVHSLPHTHVGCNCDSSPHTETASR